MKRTTMPGEETDPATLSHVRVVMRIAENIERKVDRLQIHQEQFRAEVTGRFEQVDDRFEAIDGRFEQIDQRFEQMDRRFGEVDEKLDVIVALCRPTGGELA